MDYLIRKRVVRVFWMFMLFFGGLLGHLAYIQFSDGLGLSRQAIAQQSQVIALELPARGQILDRHLRPITIEHQVWRVAVFPAAVPDRAAAGPFLASLLGIDSGRAGQYLAGTAGLLPFDLNAQQVKVLNGSGFPGLMAVQVKVRARKPVLASHTAGYFSRGRSIGDGIGQMGIEAFYDGILRENNPGALVRYFFDGWGRPIPGLGYRVEKGLDKQSRKNVVLTIDRDVQEIVEKALDKSGSVSGAVVVMDAGSGDIAALASRPDYSLGTVENKVYEGGSFLNRGLLDYQPGSVFKVVVAAAALEEGLVTPDTMFLCAGELDDLVSCYNKEGHGLLTFAQAVAYSCNPTFARVGLQLGAGKLADYARRFGLTDASMIGYRETKKRDWPKLIGQSFNLVNASLGQWPVRANAVQITAMMGVVANDGHYVPPRLVRETRNYDGSVNSTVDPGSPMAAVSPGTAKTMRTLLEKVTREGTGREAWVEPGGSAGKTGSAQVGSVRIDAWFSGYAPIDNPRYVVTVLVNNGESGGKSAAPIFRDIMQQLLNRD